VVPFAGDNTNTLTGFLVCDGTAVSRETYSTLFGIIGDTYGAGDGSTTFNLPNLEDRFPMGATTPKPVGTTGGGTATLAEENLPAHSHTYSKTTGVSTSISLSSGSQVDINSPDRNISASSTVENSSRSTTGGPTTAAAFDVTPAFIALKYIIKT